MSSLFHLQFYLFFCVSVLRFILVFISPHGHRYPPELFKIELRAQCNATNAVQANATNAANYATGQRIEVGAWNLHVPQVPWSLEPENVPHVPWTLEPEEFHEFPRAVRRTTFGVGMLSYLQMPIYVCILHSTPCIYTRIRTPPTA